MLTCDTVRALSGAFALDLLPRSEAEAVAVHVAACVACGERARARQQAGEWLAHLVSPEPVPDGLRRRLQLRLQEQHRPQPRATAPLSTSPAAPHPVVPAKPQGGSRRTLVWALALVLVLAVGGNLALWRERQDLQRAAVAAEAEQSRLLQRMRRQAARPAAPVPPPSRVSLLQGSRRYPTTTGVLVYQVDTGRWTLKLQGVPTLPAGQVYHLWAGGGERPAPVLAFRPAAATAAVPVPAHAALRPGTALLITVEAGAGQDRPTGDLVLLGMVADS